MKYTYAGDCLSRLQPGMIIIHEGRKHRVVMVNDCRARILPLEKIQRTVEQIIDGKKTVVASFSSFGAAVNISPNSICEIIGFEQPDATPIAPQPPDTCAPKRPLPVTSFAGLPRRSTRRTRK